MVQGNLFRFFTALDLQECQPLTEQLLPEFLRQHAQQHAEAILACTRATAVSALTDSFNLWSLFGQLIFSEWRMSRWFQKAPANLLRQVMSIWTMHVLQNPKVRLYVCVCL